MSDFGIWTIVPPIVVIALAIYSKKPIESLLVGCVSAYLIIAIHTGENVITLTRNAFFSVATDYDNVWIIMVCGLFGSLIALLNASNGTLAIARAIGKHCKSDRSVLLSAWGLGMIIFIDDYMNIMTVSSCLKKLCRKKNIPMSALAYVINSTSAPTCVLIPFSTWAIFYASSFFEQEAVKRLGYSSAMSAYCHAIPFMFYAIISISLVMLFAAGIVPAIGGMKEEYENATKAAKINETVGEEKGTVIDFVTPIIVMIVTTIIMDDMFIALLASILVCFVLYIPRRVVTFSEFCELWIKGFGDLVPTLAVLLFAFFMKQACADIHLPEYVVSRLLPYVSERSFPAVAFALVSVLAFVTGDSWGVPAICVPIIIPLGAACGANILLTMAAIVSGGVFCSHACFYSDATVLTSSCCDIDSMLHAKTQFPYAIIAFLLSFLLYICLGFLM